MILKSCYIENYGAIKKKTIDFNKNVTAFCEENGYGKTTLACFLEAMFYGMETDRSGGANLTARKHYLPFDGGKFGGNVAFTHGGDEYKIVRYFDEKSAVRDSLTIYKNNDVIKNPQKPVGEELLGIDQKSFRRTIFINSDEVKIESTSSINAKLGTILQGADEEANTEKAIKRIDAAAGEYKKSWGANALIPKEKKRIIELNAEIDNLQRIKDSLPEKYAKLAAYNAEAKELNEKFEAARSAELVLKDWERYDSLKSGAEESKNALSAIEEKYPRGVPKSEELSAVRAAISAKAALEKRTENLLSEQESRTLETLKQKYGQRAPTDEIISDVTKKISALSSVNDKLQTAQDGAPSERESALRNRFKGNVPQKSVLEAIDGAAAEYKAAEKTYADTPDYIIEKAASAKKSGGKKYLIMAVVCAIIAAAGIGVLMFALVPGAAVLAVGIIGLAAAGFLYLNNKTAGAVDSVQIANPEKAACERRKNNAENAVRQLIAPYGYPPEKSIDYLVESLKSDLSEYEKLLQADAEKSGRIADLRADGVNITRELNGFFALYSIEGDNYGDMLAELQRELGQFKTLADTQAKLAEQNADAVREIEKHDDVISKFCAAYGLDAATISQKTGEIASDIAAYAHAETDYQAQSKKAADFKTKKALESRPITDGDSELSEIKEKINELNAMRLKLLTEIDDCEEDAERLDSRVAEKEQCEDNLERYQKNYELLCKTKEFLQKAETQLKDRYISPIKNNFIKYANLIEAALGKKVTMTSNFEIRFERGGEERSEKYLSAGQLSICAFCFRIALIENMYANEKPFLILDDPFVNLDENHFDKVKKIIKTLSNDIQIIYFTCHKSRAL